MRNIYLVRHGRPDFPEGVRRCIGHTEIDLDEAGRRQARELEEYFQHHPVGQVYTSPLGRCRETAKILAGDRYPVTVIENLKELDMGEWENIPLMELKKNLESEPEYGEKRTEGLARMKRTIDEMVSSCNHSSEDVVCVAHAGINCCYLSYLLGSPLETSRALPQPYGCFSRIEVLPDGTLKVAELGRMPRISPDVRACEDIWEHYHTPDNVRRHCKAVCSQALQFGKKLVDAGCDLDLDLIRGASLLHDVARVKPEHAAEGARWILREGYPEVAEIVYSHHNLDAHMPEAVMWMRQDNREVSDIRICGGKICSSAAHASKIPDEKAVVYLADKLVSGEIVMTLDKRFESSRKSHCGKWNTEDSRKAYARRYEDAKRVESRITQYIEGKEKSNEINQNRGCSRTGIMP